MSSLPRLTLSAFRSKLFNISYSRSFSSLSSSVLSNTSDLPEYKKISALINTNTKTSKLNAIDEINYVFNYLKYAPLEINNKMKWLLAGLYQDIGEFKKEYTLRKEIYESINDIKLKDNALQAYIFSAFTSNTNINEKNSLITLLKSYSLYDNNSGEAIKLLNSIANDSDIYVNVYKLILGSRIEKDNDKKYQILDNALLLIQNNKEEYIEIYFDTECELAELDLNVNKLQSAQDRMVKCLALRPVFIFTKSIMIQGHAIEAEGVYRNAMSIANKCSVYWELVQGVKMGREYELFLKSVKWNRKSRDVEANKIKEKVDLLLDSNKIITEFPSGMFMRFR